MTSFRLQPGDFERIRAAAGAQGLTTSQWIRNACMAALGRTAPVPDRARVVELLQAVRRTAEEAERAVRA